MKLVVGFPIFSSPEKVRWVGLTLQIPRHQPHWSQSASTLPSSIPAATPLHRFTSTVFFASSIMAPRNINQGSSKKAINKGAWTSEEDRKLVECIQLHGAKRWKTVASKSGLNRCGKSCRMRWLNYLRPNIKRGNISDEEEDLILRLHKLLGNRWSLIAGRLPGRTDNEIKNYWNSHLSKKLQQKDSQTEISKAMELAPQEPEDIAECNREGRGSVCPDTNFDVNEFFDFSAEGSCGLEWVHKLLELDEESNMLTEQSMNQESLQPFCV